MLEPMAEVTLVLRTPWVGDQGRKMAIKCRMSFLSPRPNSRCFGAIRTNVAKFLGHILKITNCVRIFQRVNVKRFQNCIQQNMLGTYGSYGYFEKYNQFEVKLVLYELILVSSWSWGLRLQQCFFSGILLLATSGNDVAEEKKETDVNISN